MTTPAAPPEPPPEIPNEEPAGKYLTLMEHLEELRFRLFVSALAVVVGLAVSAYFGGQLIDFLKKPAEARNPDFHLQFIEPFELFVAYFRVALLGGLIFGMPMIVYQTLRCLSPAALGASLFFVAGVAFAYYVALPPALDFLLNFGGDLAEPNIRVSSYIDFVTRLLFWTGVSFETPLVVTPTIDPVTQSLVAGPIITLYFLGIILAWLVRPRRPV